MRRFFEAVWQEKSIDQYMSHYAEDFKSQNMNKRRWQRYKESLSEKYKFIEVQIRDPFLITKNNQSVISFIQDYKSDGLEDLGEKTLYVNRKADGKFEILTEVWRPLNTELIAQRKTTTTEN